MKNSTENELLSAYLDGELNAEEQARAERLLADSPAAKQLLDELRALGSTLQSLPRHKLGEDLSEQVLQTAAKRMESGNDDPSQISQLPRPLAAGQGHSRPHLVVRQLLERTKNNPRMFIWPLVIVIVAVLLTVFNPDQPGGNANRDIARAPANKSNEIEKNPADDNWAADAIIIKPNASDLVTDNDRPTIRAVDPQKHAYNTSHHVIKGDPSEDAEKTQPSAVLLAGTMIVECQISRESLRQQEYRKVFDANGVVLPEKSAAEMFQLTPAELAAAAKIDRALLEDNSNAADAKAKIIAVEVSPAQMTGIIVSLTSLRETFRNFSSHTMQLPPTPSSTAKPPETKRMLIIFHVVDSTPTAEVR